MGSPSASKCLMEGRSFLTIGFMAGNWYNGYSPQEREIKFRVLKRLIDRGELPSASGPCMLCGDPDVPVEYHSEDYGEPFLWEPPAMRSLCRHCHRDKLHKRFSRHSAWEAYLMHVRRGGYAPFSGWHEGPVFAHGHENATMLVPARLCLQLAIPGSDTRAVILNASPVPVSAAQNLRSPGPRRLPPNPPNHPAARFM